MTTKNSHHWELSPLVRVQTVKKPRRAREGRSPFDRAVPGSTCCRFSIRKAVQIYNVGTGRFLRRKIPFSREKSVSLQTPRSKNLRFLAEAGEGGSGGGACFPVHQLVKTFFDKLRDEAVWLRPFVVPFSAQRSSRKPPSRTSGRSIRPSAIASSCAPRGVKSVASLADRPFRLRCAPEMTGLAIEMLFRHTR